MAKEEAYIEISPFITDAEWSQIADEEKATVGDLPRADKEELRKILKKSKDFTLEEKMILFMLMGVKPTYEMIGQMMGMTGPGVKMAEKRAIDKCKLVAKKKGLRAD